MKHDAEFISTEQRELGAWFQYQRTPTSDVVWYRIVKIIGERDVDGFPRWTHKMMREDRVR